MMILSFSTMAQASEVSEWMGRSLQEVINLQGEPDTMIPAWQCHQQIEFLETYGYDKRHLLEATVYRDATQCVRDAAGDYSDIYIYNNPSIQMGTRRVNATFDVAVDQDGRIKSFGSGFSEPCQVSFEQWMQGNVPPECIL